MRLRADRRLWRRPAPTEGCASSLPQVRCGDRCVTRTRPPPRRRVIGLLLLARPDARDLPESVRPTPVDRRFDHPEHRAMAPRGGRDLTPAVLAVRGVRGSLLTGDLLPDLVEDRPGENPSQNAEQQPEGFVEDGAPRFRLPTHRIASSTASPAAITPTMGIVRRLASSTASAARAFT